MNVFIAIYILFWMILSEKFTFESLMVGTVMCGLVLLLNNDIKMKWNFNMASIFEKIKLWFVYILVLLKEIVISNLQVAKIVLSPYIKISPKIVSFETGIKSDINRTILANSITLTPGTITIGLDDKSLVVHCLDEIYAEGVTCTDFEKIIKKVEG